MRIRRGIESRLWRRRIQALAPLLLTSLAAGVQSPEGGEACDGGEAPESPSGIDLSPRSWMPADETLRYKIEVTLGPVRGLDIGRVSLHARLAKETASASGSPRPASDCAESQAVEASSAEPHLVATIESEAKGGFMGQELLHRIQVRWFAGREPRVEQFDEMRGSRSSTRELRILEREGRWQAEYRKDHHCKGCKGPGHFADGFLPWSDPSHCDDCYLISHRVWRPPKFFDVPADTVDILSALYVARKFLEGGKSEAELSLVQQDDLWRVRLRRGEQRRIETSAGEFDCVRVLIGPELAAGGGLGDGASKRFEALFGLHGDISVWVDAKGWFPVRIEGEAPFGPFNVAVRASLTGREGG